DGEMDAADDLLVRTDAAERLSAQHILAPLNVDAGDFGKRRRRDQQEAERGEEPTRKTRNRQAHDVILLTLVPQSEHYTARFALSLETFVRCGNRTSDHAVSMAKTPPVSATPWRPRAARSRTAWSAPRSG